MDESWIVIPKWDSFQHYKNRDPSWVKVYTRLLRDDAYLRLSGHLRAVLHGLWLVYASSDGQLTVDARSLSHHLHLRVKSSDLDLLNHAGFIEFSASKPLSARSQAAIPETEKRRDKEKDLRGKGGDKPPAPRTPASLEVATTNQKHPVGKLREVLDWIGDHADQHTAHVVATKWVQAPEHVQVQVMDATFTASPRNRAAYVVQILNGSPSALKEIA